MSDELLEALQNLAGEWEDAAAKITEKYGTAEPLAWGLSRASKELRELLSAASKGQSININHDLAGELFVAGGNIILASRGLGELRKCQHCGGSGKVETWVECGACGGQRIVLVQRGHAPSPVTCQQCNGTGRVRQQAPCEVCEGKGEFRV